MTFITLIIHQVSDEKFFYIEKVSETRILMSKQIIFMKYYNFLAKRILNDKGY